MTFLGRSARILTATLLAAAVSAQPWQPPPPHLPPTPTDTCGHRGSTSPTASDPRASPSAVGLSPTSARSPTATSIAPTCAPATGRVISQSDDDTPAVGMKLDRKGRLWVAGGADGDAKVVDTRTGRELANYDFVGDSTEPSFVNDVVLFKGAAWFTDSQRPVLYKVSPRQRAGRPRPGCARSRSRVPGTRCPTSSTPTASAPPPTVAHCSSCSRSPGSSSRSTRATGTHPRSDSAATPLTNGDGMLRQGRVLYVAQNRDNKVAAIRLTKRAASADSWTR